MLNDHFHRLVHGEPSLAPTFRDALTVARRISDLRQSQREGRRITPKQP